VIALAAAFVVAFVITLLTTPGIMKLARRHGAMAIPRDRDVHDKPTPRWGGIAIYLGTVCAMALSISYRHWRTGGANGWTPHLVGLLLAATFIAIIGMIDDIRDLRPHWQILAICISGAILMAFGVRIEGISNPAAWLSHDAAPYNPSRWLQLPTSVSVIATLFWVLLVTKTVDAIDGLDGLAAGVCAISSATLALLTTTTPQPGGPAIGLAAASVAGACVGFLPYNFNPARVFMSTVGAQFLGMMLAGISIMGPFKAATAVSVLVPLLILGVPIFDYGVVLFRRVRQGAPLMQADRRHLHHRLLARGMSQKQAVCIIYSITFVLCLAAFLLFSYAKSRL
jgi:UDP-GlcNAc:undecaprenyl-phosphate GlcNAc-1-phosphate transferase